MEELDLQYLPIDFVGKSKPSKKIDAIYEKKKITLKRALDSLNSRKEEICEKYNKIFKEESELLKRNLNDTKGLIKNELYESTLASNYDNTKTIDINYFKQVYKRILELTSQKNDFVDNFYLDLVKNEKEKAKEFTEILKTTYEEIRNNTYKLPYECDEIIEFEIEKLNQTILCNNRNYAKLKFELKSEIENYAKNTIQDLQYVKECWIKYVSNQNENALNELRNTYVPVFADTVQTLGTKIEEATFNLQQIDSLIKNKEPEEWLKITRQTMANLDRKAKKITMDYKQASVIVYNRFFQELKTIAETLKDIPNFEHFPLEEIEVYTPTLKEIRENYDVEFEKIQTAWNDLMIKLLETMDNNYRFLNALTILWENHFQRTEVLRMIILRDLENTIKLNNKVCKQYETEHNILIDTLRQESSQEKAKKTFESIKKMLKTMEEKYHKQYQSEVTLFKKYKGAFDLEMDILLAEITRFLEIYPPDKEKDPKIQRKRASQTSDIAASIDDLIPNQMIYCKYQIDAISNWQFGIWEIISNYVLVAKTEIQSEIDKWIQNHIEYLNVRKEIRFRIHETRLEKIMAYIYEERLEELCKHENRLGEHKNAVEKYLQKIKEDCKCLKHEKIDMILMKFQSKISTIESNSFDAENSYAVAAFIPILNSKTKNALEEIDNAASQYLLKCDDLFEAIQNSHGIYLKTVKLFSEGGNFSTFEVKKLLKNLEKIEKHAKTIITNLKKDVDTKKVIVYETINEKKREVTNFLEAIFEEHKFKETLIKKRKILEKTLVNEVCTHQYNFQILTDEFEQFKREMSKNCENYDSLENFADSVKSITRKLTGIEKYLEIAVPVRLFSNMSKLELPPEIDHLPPTPLTKTPVMENEKNFHEMTNRLFNFKMGELENPNTFFLKLNSILRKHWEETIAYVTEFYKGHRNVFYLEEKNILTSLPQLMNELYNTYNHFQSQCETKVMQDTNEFLCFSFDYLIFCNDQFEMYMKEFCTKTLKNFDKFYNKEVKQILENYKNDMKTKYLDLQKKLKPSFGHPKNRMFLEKLQIQAENIYSDAKEYHDTIKTPLYAKLKEKFDEFVNNYLNLNQTLRKIEQILNEFKTILIELNKKLNEKVRLFRMMLNCRHLEISQGILKHDECILNNCKSFLKFYDSKSSHQFDNGAIMIISSFQKGVVISSRLPSPFISSEDMIRNENSKEFSDDTTDDLFFIYLREYHSKFCTEIENENLDDFLHILRAQWWCAVKNVLDLYTVKYDQCKNLF
ncbi:hypothetical protein ABEB36_002621 [Hypothenemus hampei]|uniref:DUF4455 domain-containing protein n=1 Tax=Hypothenemus hampei TaxID=57062 RepID=A0ABD1F6E5_HYPHA